MKCVLIIDDDHDDAEVFREALQETHPSVSCTWYNDARAAIEVLEISGRPLPHLIFLDINMPSLNGWQCLERIRRVQELSSIPVIMYTTSSQSNEKKKALELGAQDFITKPDDYNQLKQILREVLAR